MREQTALGRTQTRRAFDEDYAPMYVKTVKGYKFVGVHFDTQDGYYKEGAIAAFLESHRDELAGSKPFFYTQHFHPLGLADGQFLGVIGL